MDITGQVDRLHYPAGLRDPTGLAYLPEALQGTLQAQVILWGLEIPKSLRWGLSGRPIESDASCCLLCQGKGCATGLDVGDPPAGGPGVCEVLLA